MITITELSTEEDCRVQGRTGTPGQGAQGEGKSAFADASRLVLIGIVLVIGIIIIYNRRSPRAPDAGLASGDSKLQHVQRIQKGSE